jgi:hypothetical protein
MTTHYALGSIVHADGTRRAWNVIGIHRHGGETFARLLPHGDRSGDSGPRTIDTERLSSCAARGDDHAACDTRGDSPAC